MVVKLVRWPSWPPFSSRKYEAIVNIGRLEGVEKLSSSSSVKELSDLVVEIKWKGHKTMALGSWRRSFKRNYTQKGNVSQNGASIVWNEEFATLCSFLGSKQGLIPPWKVSFTLLQNRENQVLRKSYAVVGTATVNLAEYTNSANGREIQISLPLKVHGTTAELSAELSPLLLLSLSLLELRRDAKPLRVVPRSIVPVTLSPPSRFALLTEKDGLGVIRTGLDRVKIFRHCVSAGRPKDDEEEIASVNGLYIKDMESSRSSSLDSDSLEDGGNGNDDDSYVGQPIGYEKLSHANRLAESLLSGITTNNIDECWMYRGSGAGCSDADSDNLQVMQQNSMCRILSWRKRKLSFKSSKIKREPLLKKHYGENGGDDIDFDRRQLTTIEPFSMWYNLELSAAAFGDDNFAVGTWERKEVKGRDGYLEFKTEVFFASIDQRSERASGESACTALVVVIADWLLSNQHEMPTKSELDNLIRDGSAEWRNLCENEDYMEQFSDKHFDLDTVIDAKIRPLSVVPENSYVGFFHPEGLEEEGVFEFLKDTMSFNTIWDEISLLAADLSTNELIVYIVSWNDHFFILKVDKDAYYIIDTLGERLYEGCNQAYILKFDKETVINKLPNNTKESEEKTSVDTNQSKSSGVHQNNADIEEKSSIDDSEEPSKTLEETSSSPKKASSEKKNESINVNTEEQVVCTGKECCQEYIKRFLAAIPVREWLKYVKMEGSSSSTSLHQRLQIEFHRAEVVLKAADQVLVKATTED